MKKLIYIITIIGVIIFTPQVYAYNSNYVPDLSLNGNSFYYFYGWNSNTEHGTGTLMSWFSESNNVGLPSQIAYKYFTPTGSLQNNDSNGFSIFFSNDNVFTKDRTYNGSFFICSYRGSIPVSSINVGTGSNVSTVNNSNLATINSFDYTSISGVSDGMGATFNDCKLITTNFKVNVSGNYISLRYRTNTTTSMGTMVAFLGANFDDSGLDYTTYFNNINTSITNLSTTIQNRMSTMETNITNSMNSVDNSINNSNVDNPDNIFSSIQNSMASNGVITQLLTLPITFYTKVLNSLNSTCVDYSAGFLLGTEIVFPCINVSNYIGATLWGVIDVLISGIFIFNLSKKFIKIFNDMSSMREGDIIND